MSIKTKQKYTNIFGIHESRDIEVYTSLINELIDFIKVSKVLKNKGSLKETIVNGSTTNNRLSFFKKDAQLVDF